MTTASRMTKGMLVAAMMSANVGCAADAQDGETVGQTSEELAWALPGAILPSFRRLGEDDRACLESRGTANGASLAFDDCNGTSEQRWSYKARPQADGLALGNVLWGPGGKCLDAVAGTPRMTLWPCHGASNQQWTFDHVRVRSALGKCLSFGRYYTEGARVFIEPCDSFGSSTQQFQLRQYGYFGGEYGLIEAKDPRRPYADADLCLAVAGGSAQGTAIELRPCGFDSSVLWKWGAHGFVSKLSADRCLDVRGGSREDGTPLQLWQCNGTSAQRFFFRGPIRAPYKGSCIAAVADGSGTLVPHTMACDASAGYMQSFDYFPP